MPLDQQRDRDNINMEVQHVREIAGFGFLYGLLTTIFMIGASLSTDSPPARGWIFVALWVFVLPLFVAAPFIFRVCYSWDFTSSFTPMIKCILVTSLVVIIPSTFLASWALNYAVDVQAVGIDTKGFTVLDPCLATSTEGNPHAFLKWENQSYFRKWTISPWQLERNVTSTLKGKVIDIELHVMKGSALNLNGLCQVNLHPDIEGDWRETIRDGGELYCGDASFYLAANFPLEQEENPGSDDGEEQLDFKAAYLAKYSTTPLCRGIRPQSTANEEFAFRIIIVSVLVFAVTFLLWSVFTVRAVFGSDGSGQPNNQERKLDEIKEQSYSTYQEPSPGRAVAHEQTPHRPMQTPGQDIPGCILAEEGDEDMTPIRKKTPGGGGTTDRSASPKQVDYSDENYYHTPGSLRRSRAVSGGQQTADVWTASYENDEVTLCALLDEATATGHQHSSNTAASLVNMRGGIGLHVDVRNGAVILGHNVDQKKAATPLHYAIAGNAHNAVAALLSRGANPRVRTSHGSVTASELAQIVGNEGLLLGQ